MAANQLLALILDYPSRWGDQKENVSDFCLAESNQYGSSLSASLYINDNDFWNFLMKTSCSSDVCLTKHFPVLKF